MEFGAIEGAGAGWRPARSPVATVPRMETAVISVSNNFEIILYNLLNILIFALALIRWQWFGNGPLNYVVLSNALGEKQLRAQAQFRAIYSRPVS